MATVVKFEVGESEQHEVVYSWDQMWGSRSIKVDGKAIQKSRTVLSFSLKQMNEFQVGVTEKHDVRIEKTRQLLFAGFRPQKIQAFVDGKQVAAGVSELTPQNVRSALVFGIVAGIVAGVVVVILAATFVFSVVSPPSP
jgi:hypothetical protein